MTLLNVKNRRKIFDTGIITVLAVSAYLIGFFQVQNMGALTFAVVLPCFFLILLGSAHLVLRTGRKFDETVHNPEYQLVEVLALAVTAGTGYYLALSGGNSFKVASAVFGFSFLLSVYLMGYRPNS